MDSEIKKILEQYIDLQQEKKDKEAAVEQYINSVEDSRMRSILTYRYIDGLSWQQVANKIGGGNTEDS